jgi:hypothetical protein
MFKHVWKLLDPQSKFVGTGGPIEVASLPAHLDKVHNGVGHVSVNQLTNPINLEVKLNDRAAPLAKFQAQNGGPIAHPGYPVEPNSGRIPPNARFPGASGTLPPQTISIFGPVSQAMKMPGGGGPVDPFPGLSKLRDQR